MQLYPMHQYAVHQFLAVKQSVECEPAAKEPLLYMCVASSMPWLAVS